MWAPLSESLHPEFMQAENPVLELDATETPLQSENLALRALLGSIRDDGDDPTLAFERCQKLGTEWVCPGGSGGPGRNAVAGRQCLATE